ncbi:MAG: ribosome assembly cofactor RimP [Muribaculaceae bacterium]|nr:ribosome assembly cofactor RimP [Muribaculaceae bacterium]
MIEKQAIEQVVTDAITGTDIFIVDIRISPDNMITVELDSTAGLDIDTCARITRAIEAAVDRDVEDYELEVGSAGLTAPFKVPAQYVKNIGNDIEVLTRDGRKLTGKLVEVCGTDFTIEISRKVKEPGAKRPVMVTEPVSLTMDNVKRACYLIDFK